MSRTVLQKTFHEYAVERTDSILFTAMQTNCKYSEVSKEFIDTLRKLIDFANTFQNQELKSIIMDFESIANFQCDLAAELAYKEGLRDGYNIHQELKDFFAINMDNREAN